MRLHGRPVGQVLAGGELLLRGHQRGLRRSQRGVRVAHARLRVIHFLATDGAGGDESLPPREVVLGLGEIGARPRDFGLAQRDVRRSGRIRRVERAHFADRLRERRLRLRQRHFGIGAIERDQRSAGLDEVGIVGVDRHDGAGHLRRDLHEVALHVRVVGALVVAQRGEPVRAIEKAGGHERAARNDQPLEACALRGFGSCGFSHRMLLRMR